MTARVGIGPIHEGAFGLDVELDVRVPELEREEAEELAALAHEVCPYSNATRGSLDVRVNVVD